MISTTKNVSMKTVRLLTTESEPLAEKASTVLLDSVSSCVICLICWLTSFTDSILSRRKVITALNVPAASDTSGNTVSAG